MESGSWEEGQEPKDVSPILLITHNTANKLHDDYIYDEKVMRGHTLQKTQGPKENSANITG